MKTEMCTIICPTTVSECMVFIHAAALEYLISAGCQVNQPAGENHTTALHYAVSGEHAECIQVLLQYGAEVNPLMTTEEVQHSIASEVEL